MNPKTTDYATLEISLRSDYRQIIERDVAARGERESHRQFLRLIVRSYLDDLDLAGVIGIRIQALEDQLSSIEQRANEKRRLVARGMTAAGLTTLDAPGFWAECYEVPAPLVVTAEADIPAVFWRQSVAELDHDAVLAALRTGREMRGATLGETETSITVKVR